MPDNLDPAIAAKWIVAAHYDHGDVVTNLRLQKLLYYAQAWALALRDAPLFDEDFEAWVHGPVLRSVYQIYRMYGASPLPAPEAEATEEEVPYPKIDSDLHLHLAEVMEAYGPLSTWELEKLTHDEEPWMEARGELPMDAACRRTISKETMKRYYRTMYERSKGKA